MTEQITLSEKQLSSIQEVIQTAMQKRSVFAKLEKFEQDDKGRLQFRSETFNTVPSLFKSIRVVSWSSSIAEREGCIKVWANVHFSYEHYESGSNGCDFFNFQCEFYIREDNTVSDRIGKVTIF